eukprot:TRINITY_DN7370_c0_g1_i1.p1 TRINITY_DN7370_c0_g1~~TRINITY_DN7370_c0_g1_i1.p1  ORF type:complete len:451 (+),score=107.35 TRINITY_DN7370_c0_g1_i1:1-1353(+)
MHLTNYIKKNGIEKLEKTFRLKVKRHTRHPNLIQFHYHQIESDFKHKIVKESRGIIIDEITGEIVSYPYDKFFNYAEPNAMRVMERQKDLRWEKAKVYHKLDGSIMVLYWYAGTWYVSSSGIPDASGLVPGLSVSFADEFWRVFHMLGYELPEDHRYCYMFELMLVENTIIVQHKQDDLVFHGARNLDSFEEVDPDDVVHNWKVAESFDFDSLDDVIEASKMINPVEQEGFVVRFEDFSRVKVKSPQYVALHHLSSFNNQNGRSFRRILQIVVTNESDEFLAYYPDWRDNYLIVKERYDEMIEEISRLYADLSKREFEETRYGDLLKRLDSGESSKQIFRDSDIRIVEKYIEKPENWTEPQGYGVDSRASNWRISQKILNGITALHTVLDQSKDKTEYLGDLFNFLDSLDESKRVISEDNSVKEALIGLNSMCQGTVALNRKEKLKLIVS